MGKFADKIDDETIQQAKKLEAFAGNRKNLVITRVKGELKSAFSDQESEILAEIEKSFSNVASGYVNFVGQILSENETFRSYESYASKNYQSKIRDRVRDALRYVRAELDGQLYRANNDFFSRDSWPIYKQSFSQGKLSIDQDQIKKDAKTHYNNVMSMFVTKNVFKIARVVGDRSDLESLDVKVHYSQYDGLIIGRVKIKLSDAEFAVKIQVINAIRYTPRVVHYTQYRATFHDATVSGKRIDITGGLLDVGIALGAIDPRTKQAAIDLAKSGFKEARDNIRDKRKTFSDEAEWFKRWTENSSYRSSEAWKDKPPESLRGTKHGDKNWLSKQDAKKIKGFKEKAQAFANALKRLLSWFHEGEFFDEWNLTGTIMPRDYSVKPHSGRISDIHQIKYREAAKIDFGWLILKDQGRWYPGVSGYLLFQADSIDGLFSPVSFAKRDDAKKAIIKYGSGVLPSKDGKISVWARDKEHALEKTEARSFGKFDNVPAEFWNEDDLTDIQKIELGSESMRFWLLSVISSEEIAIIEGYPAKFSEVKGIIDAQANFHENESPYSNKFYLSDITPEKPNPLLLMELMKKVGLVDYEYKFTKKARPFYWHAQVLEAMSKYDL